MYKHVALKSLVLMECRSAYLVNFNGAALIRCYFCRTDEFDLGCNNKSLLLFLNNKGKVMDAE